MLQLESNTLNKIYVISNMHLNYNLCIRPSGRFSLKKVSLLCEGKSVGSIPIFLRYVLDLR
jgi:hypothetical protein